MTPKQLQRRGRPKVLRAPLFRRSLQAATETESWRRLVEVERLAMEGVQDAGIAAALGLCPQHVQVLRRKLGISRARARAIQAGRAEALLKQLETLQVETGVEWRTLAKDCRLTAQTLRNWRFGRGHPSPRTLDRVERFLPAKQG